MRVCLRQAPPNRHSALCTGNRACADAPDRAVCVLSSEEVIERMPFVTCHMSISLDGFVAGPHQSADNPLGIDGRKLHDWHLNGTAAIRPT